MRVLLRLSFLVATASLLPGGDLLAQSSDARTLFLRNSELRDPRLDALRSVDEERLLEAEAARLGKTVRQLLKDLLPARPVSEAAIRRTFERIREQQPAASYDQMLPVIRMFLEGQLQSDARAKYIDELKRAEK